MNKEFLETMYIKELKSVKEIAQTLQLPEAAIYRVLKKFNIKRTKDQINIVRKRTNIEVYGFGNINQVKEIRNKGASTYRRLTEEKYDLSLIKELYIDQDLTSEQVGKELNIDKSVIRQLLRKNNIKKDKKLINQKRYETMKSSIQNKYGVDNIKKLKK